MSLYKYFKYIPDSRDEGKCNVQFITYRCKICSEELQLQFAGSHVIGTPSFDEQNNTKMMRHLEFHEIEKRLKLVGIEINE